MDRAAEVYLDKYFGQYTVTPVSGGKTDAQLYSISTKTGQYILKYQKSNLLNYYLNLTWLKDKVPVPDVVFYEQTEAFGMLCMTALRGKPLINFIGKIENTEVVKRYAQALKLLHGLQIDAGAVRQNLTARIWQAKYNAENALIDRVNLQPENQLMSSANLYAKLIASAPQDFDLVFTHGDYCMDNLFFDSHTLTGFIDLDRGGIADRYQDIALAVRSIKYELGEDLIPMFFQVYGLQDIDQKKIDFYTLLDEFF